MERTVQGDLTLEELDYMDMFGSDEVQSALARVHGKYIDELEEFEGYLGLFETRAKEFSEDIHKYENLRTQGTCQIDNDTVELVSPEDQGKAKRLGHVLIESAGSHIHKRRELLQRQRVAYETRGEKLSRAIGGYLLERLSSQEAVFIAGQLYYINEGYFISRKPKEKAADEWECRVFAGSETTREFSMKHYGLAGDGTKRKLFPKQASAEHWQEWLHDLERATNQ